MSRMEILDIFGDPFRSMMRRMPFSDSFAQKLVQNVKKRTDAVRRAIESLNEGRNPK